MSEKHYMKMADVFNLPVKDEDRESAVELFSRMVCAPYSADYTVVLSQYAAHAINSHDELVAENERLRTALECATNHFPDTAEMVQDGWQLVPKVPTREMIEQGNAAMAYDCCSGDASDAYQAMLATAPKLRD